ncbi:fimbrial protein [Pseudomonas sp. KCJK9016]|uniref:fimbrial protein n=1 Tax=Pseudomonas sp. KCJK9016 TaxID=3344556 RepID=UPI0039062A36
MSILALLIVAPQMANADACKWANSNQAAQTINFSLPGPNITIPRDTAVGTVVASSGPMPMPASASITCINGNYGLSYISSQPSTSAQPSPVGNTGLGLLVKYNDGGILLYPSPLNATVGFNNKTFTLQVIKTAETIATNAEIPAGVFASIKADGVTPITFSILNSIKIINPTCTIDELQTISMGKQKIVDFKGINSHSLKIPFNISLRNCPASAHGMSIQFDPTTDTQDGFTGSLSNSSTAKGIGVQLFAGNNDTPLKLRTSYPIASKVEANSNLTVPFKVAYTQTLPEISAGNANTSFTFTINYQ